jgi:hypothetical protein
LTAQRRRDRRHPCRSTAVTDRNHHGIAGTTANVVKKSNPPRCKTMFARCDAEARLEPAAWLFS